MTEKEIIFYFYRWRQLDFSGYVIICYYPEFFENVRWEKAGEVSFAFFAVVGFFRTFCKAVNSSAADTQRIEVINSFQHDGLTFKSA